MKYLIICCVFSVCLFRCVPTPLDIEIPEKDPEIVVFSQVIPNTLMSVILTRSISSLEFSEENGDTITNSILDNLLVDDAQVSITFDGQTESLIEVANGFYLSTFPLPEVSTELTLNIESDGKKLNSTSLLLPQISFEEIIPSIERTEKDTLVSIDYTIQDFPEDNWYMINFYTQGQSSLDSTGLDLNSFFQRGTNVNTKTVVVSDKIFEGARYEGTIELPEISQTDSLVVTISNINEDYFDYLSLRNTSSNFFTELTKEPINYPTNIENGLGFFNTHFPDVKFFDLNEF